MPLSRLPAGCYSSRSLCRPCWSWGGSFLFLLCLCNFAVNTMTMAFIFKIFLFIWLCWVLAAACNIVDLCCGMGNLQLRHANSVVACGILLPDQGSNPETLHWVLATGLPGKSIRTGIHGLLTLGPGDPHKAVSLRLGQEAKFPG